MAATAHKKEEDKKEYFDSEEELDQKISLLAQWIQESQHFITFTGAGISTSTGIPDFRSGYNTVLPTGPGAWEVRAQKKAVPQKAQDYKKVALKAIPSTTHMSFVKLQEQNVLKYVVSQNTDGLHRKSGINPDQISELHGNTNLEKCKKCKREFMRDFRTRNNQNVHKHETGRVCDDPKCKGVLLDTIINFGEGLDEIVLTKAYENGYKSDLCLAMGSSLRVHPAADIPYQVAKKGGKLVIVNLQKTPLDNIAALRIGAMCDVVMQRLMQKLSLQIPSFRLKRRLKVQKERLKNGKTRIEWIGVDVDQKVFTQFPKIKVKVNNKQVELQKEPFYMEMEVVPVSCEVTLFFQGHYGEKQFDVMVDLNG